jgi:8-oxo-dGTP pyrophosphatase MutT (NUDIX family)
MTPAAMRTWIAERLDPLDSYDPDHPLPALSEFTLNPSLPKIESFRPAAVLVPLIEHEAGVTVLFTRRADTLRSHTGQTAFPGGRMDEGETPWAAALRETEEEIGLAPSHIELAGLLPSYQTGSGYDITPVVGFVTPGFTLDPNPAEVAEVFEAPLAFVLDPKNHERQFRDMPDGQRRSFYAITYDGHLIWGATAGILRVLHDRLYGEPAPSA